MCDEFLFRAKMQNSTQKVGEVEITFERNYAFMRDNLICRKPRVKSELVSADVTIVSLENTKKILFNGVFQNLNVIFSSSSTSRK